MSMDNYLAEIYGTPGTDAGQSENLEKAAEAELFVKLAADNGIDLNSLNDGQIQELYNETFSKVAEDDEKCPKCGKVKCECPAAKDKDKGDMYEKESAANAEFLEKKAEQEKWAEADRMGRIMAHAYVQELGLIGNNLEKGAAAEGDAEEGGSTTGAAAEGDAVPTKDPKTKDEKTASAIDELAVPLAIEKVAEQGWDKEEATERVSAVYTLGLGESEKTASAGTLEEAVDTRALEFLEAAGYPVSWNQE